jgi:hypothetical protein
MPRLFHVSDDGPFTAMSPRPSPSGKPHEGRKLVWAVDEKHLPNYLLPRECPRVCWATARTQHSLLSSPASRVIVVEHGWLPRLLRAGLNVHHLDPANFELLDAAAGYWVSERTVQVRDVRQVDDCITALARRNVELRLTVSLWPYADAVVSSGVEFSAIRLRNARARQAVDSDVD